MEKILKLIPNKIEDNQDIEKMIQYLNNSIKEMDVIVFERQKEKMRISLYLEKFMKKI